MRVWTTTIAFCVLVAAAAPAAAQLVAAPGTNSAIEGEVGNQILQVRYLLHSPVSGVAGDLNFGGLLTEDRQFMASAAWMFDAQIPVSHLRLQVGPEANLALLSGNQKTDIFAVALGASVRWEFFTGISAIGSAFYSPGVLTFGSAHNMYDFTAGAEFRLSDQLSVLAGYRWLKFTLINQPSDRVSNEVFGGIRWKID